MQKVITLFQRNYDTDRLVRDEIVPGAEWVVNGEGIATRKWDGQCCALKSDPDSSLKVHVLYRRYELKAGKPAPERFIPAQEPDPKTGDQPGWMPVDLMSKADQWFHAAFLNFLKVGVAELGTYEAIGPHFGGGSHDKNPEGLPEDMLIAHDKAGLLHDFPRDFHAIRCWFQLMQEGANPSIEGVVWHHDDGRMVKIKARDFGIRRPGR
jgi:hypothetical protein